MGPFASCRCKKSIQPAVPGGRFTPPGRGWCVEKGMLLVTIIVTGIVLSIPAIRVTRALGLT